MKQLYQFIFWFLDHIKHIAVKYILPSSLKLSASISKAVSLGCFLLMWILKPLSSFFLFFLCNIAFLVWLKIVLTTFDVTFSLPSCSSVTGHFDGIWDRGSLVAVNPSERERSVSGNCILCSYQELRCCLLRPWLPRKLLFLPEWLTCSSHSVLGIPLLNNFCNIRWNNYWDTWHNKVITFKSQARCHR